MRRFFARSTSEVRDGLLDFRPHSPYVIPSSLKVCLGLENVICSSPQVWCKLLEISGGSVSIGLEWMQRLHAAGGKAVCSRMEMYVSYIPSRSAALFGLA